MSDPYLWSVLAVFGPLVAAMLLSFAMLNRDGPHRH